MAVVSELVCVLIGVLGLGFITEPLSKPIRYGYMNGIALTVLISQLPNLFGFSIDEIRSIARSRADHRRRSRRTGSAVDAYLKERSVDWKP
jgi:MFS superfamily sulfate permease-like transporter